MQGDPDGVLERRLQAIEERLKDLATTATGALNTARRAESEHRALCEEVASQAREIAEKAETPDLAAVAEVAQQAKAGQDLGPVLEKLTWLEGAVLGMDTRLAALTLRLDQLAPRG